MVPLFRKGNMVGIGMVYPENILAQNALRFLSQRQNFTYEIYLISFSDFNNILKQHKTLKRETKRALVELGKEETDVLPNTKEDASMTFGEDAPIIKMVL